MSLRVVTAPAALVTVAEAKVHLRVQHSDDDTRIGGLIQAATESIEAATQRRFMTQELEWVLSGWRPALRLPVAPVSLDDLAITFIGEGGVSATMSPEGYRLAPSGATACISPLAAWPMLDAVAGERVVIRFKAGETSPPSAAVEACKLLIEHVYEARDWPLAASGLPTVVETFIAPLRWD